MGEFKKNFIWNILGTTFNSFLSLFFLVIVTRFNGIENAGIFTLAFSTACIIYVIGIYSGRIFQVTENSDINDKEYIANRVITTMLMIIIIIGFVIIKKYDFYKSSIFILLTLFKSLEAFSDVLYGILQKNDKLYQVGISLFFKALISIIVFILLDFFTKKLILSCISIIICNLVFILIYDIPNVLQKIEKNSKIQRNNVIKIFKNGFFTFAITFLGLYIINASKYSIDNFLSEDIQAIYGIIIMPATVISLFGQFIIHPYLNKIMDICKKKNKKEFNKLLIRIITYITIMGAISAILAYLLGIPVLNIIYGITLGNYSLQLCIIIIAATLYTISVICSSILTAVRHTFIQFIVYIICSVVAFVFSNSLVKLYGINGAIGAYLLVMFLLGVLYFALTKVIINKEFKKEILNG